MTTQDKTDDTRGRSLVVDRQFGPYLADSWVPAPRYLLRRDRMLNRLLREPNGCAVEVGCGGGALLRELADAGHRCIGLETSSSALRIARTMLAGQDSASVVASPGADWAERFDILVSMEVLEHIEHDEAALAEWLTWVRPGGLVVLSVPAHMARWSEGDTWAGHFRRYEKAELLGLAVKLGLVVESLECYGFPLANLTSWVANSTVRTKRKAGDATDAASATAASGTDRSAELRLFGLQRSIFGRMATAAAVRTQRGFLATELGDGLLLFARKQ